MNHSLRDDYAAPTEKVEILALDLYRRTGRLNMSSTLFYIIAVTKFGN
jgi:hypothetical protein